MYTYTSIVYSPFGANSPTIPILGFPSCDSGEHTRRQAVPETIHPIVILDTCRLAGLEVTTAMIQKYL